MMINMDPKRFSPLDLLWELMEEVSKKTLVRWVEACANKGACFSGPKTFRGEVVAIYSVLNRFAGNKDAQRFFFVCFLCFCPTPFNSTVIFSGFM